MQQNISTNLIKINNNCTESIADQLDNVNTIRLVMACATKKDFKFVKKKKLNFGKLSNKIK